MFLRSSTSPGVDFTKSRKFKINRKCYRKCDFQDFDWLKFTLTTDLRLTTFCEIDHRCATEAKSVLSESTLISPLSICNLCDEIRNLVKFLLCSKDFNIHKYFSSPKFVLNLL